MGNRGTAGATANDHLPSKSTGTLRTSSQYPSLVGMLAGPASRQLLDRGRASRAAEEEALELIAPMFAEERQLLFRLHALGDYAQAECAREGDDRNGDGGGSLTAGRR